MTYFFPQFTHLFTCWCKLGVFVFKIPFSFSFKCNKNPGLSLILCVLKFDQFFSFLKWSFLPSITSLFWFTQTCKCISNKSVSTLSSRYSLVWMHSTVGLFQPSWLILSASRTPNTAAFAIPPLSHPMVPLFMWPLWPVLCDSTARGPRAQVAMTMTLEGLSQPRTHTSTDTLAYTLRQGRRSIFYYTEGSVGGWGGGGVGGRWELHCSELTAETPGKLERGWVCFSESVCLREHRRLHLSLDSRPRKFLGFSLSGTCPKCTQCAAKWPVSGVLISHSTVHNLFDFWSMWAIRASFKIDDPCGI